MTRLSPILSAFLILLTLALAVPAGAAELQPGRQLQPITLPDQHDKEQSIDARTRFVIFARDKESSQLINGLLETAGADFLPTRDAVYLADISGMPGIIRDLFAMPKMRKYPYRIMLDRDAKASADFPGKAGSATLVHLRNLQVEKIEFPASPEDLRRALGAAPAPAVSPSPVARTGSAR